jgi:hypothetical protein
MTFLVDAFNWCVKNDLGIKEQKENLMAEALIAGLFSLVFGLWLGVKLSSKVAVPVLKDRDRTQAIDRANYLRVLQRELANILIWRDPQRYISLFKKLTLDCKQLESWRSEEIKKRLAELSEKYPFYENFDVIELREYVLYADGIWQSYDELENAYIDIVMFEALSVEGDPTWKDAVTRGSIRKFSSQDTKHLSKYVQMIEDTKFRLRIDQAMKRYYSGSDAMILDNDFYSVKMNLNNHSPATEYLIHLKATNEFAIYELFTYDSGKTTNTFYRSDSTFETRDLIISVSHGLLEEIERFTKLSSI